MSRYATAGGPLAATAGGDAELAGTADGKGSQTATRPRAVSGRAGSATASGARAAVAGPLGAPEGEVPLTLPGQYVVALRAADGAVRNEVDVLSFDAVREHTAISDWEAVVPLDPELQEWAFSEVTISYGDSTVFRGRLEEIDTDQSSAEAVLSGRGPGWRLAFGDITVRYSGIAAWRAIERFWAEHTDFVVTITPPARQRFINDREFSGSPLEILQELHEDYGMRFTIDQRSATTRAMSYPRDHVIREVGWTPTNGDEPPGRDVGDYANSVVVYGAERENGEGYSGSAADAEEIEAKGEEITWREDDPDLESHADCQERAEALLEELSDLDGASGTQEIVPQMVQPGPRVTIEQWDQDRVIGPYALALSGGCLEIDGAMLGDLAWSGTISTWIRAPFGEGVVEPYIFGAEHSVARSREFRVDGDRGLTLQAPTTAEALAEVQADPAQEIEGGSWSLIHYGWRYDPAADQTDLYGGHSGAWETTDRVDGHLDLPPDGRFTIGCWRSNHFHGGVDDPTFRSRLIRDDEIEALADRQEIAADGLVARFTFRDGGRAPDRGYTHDAIGGWHALIAEENGGVEFTGTPVSIEQVELTESAGKASGSIELARVHGIGDTLAALERSQRSIRRTM